LVVVLIVTTLDRVHHHLKASVLWTIAPLR